MKLIKKIILIILLSFSATNFTHADSDINYDLERIMKMIQEKDNKKDLAENYSVDEVKNAVSKYDMLKFFAEKVDIEDLEDYSSINEYMQIVAYFETKLKNDSKNSVYRNGVNTAKGYFQFINATYHRTSDKLREFNPDFPWSWNIYDYSYAGQAQLAITLWYQSAKYNNDLSSFKGLYERDYESGYKVYCSYHHTDCGSQLSAGRYKELKKALEAWSKDVYFVDLDKKGKLKKEEERTLRKIKREIEKTIKKVKKLIEDKIEEKKKAIENQKNKEKSRKIEKEKEVKKSQKINKDSNNEDSEENTDTQNNNENSSPEDDTNTDPENNDNENTESDEESHTDDTENNESSSDNEETNGDDNDDDEEVSGDNANDDEEADNNS